MKQDPPSYGSNSKLYINLYINLVINFFMYNKFGKTKKHEQISSNVGEKYFLPSERYMLYMLV